MQEETLSQYFTRLEKEVAIRVARLREMPAPIAEGLARFGAYVRSLRMECGWTRQAFAAKIGRSRIWVTLLEEGLLSSEELTDEDLRMIDHTFDETPVDCPELSDVFHREISSPPSIVDWEVWKLKKFPSIN